MSPSNPSEYVDGHQLGHQPKRQPMPAWDALLFAALLGLEGRGRRANLLDERGLLDQIALQTAARRAGFMPLADTMVLPPAAPAETRPACHYETALHLHRVAEVRQSTHQHATDTAVLHLAERGKRLPHAILTPIMQAYNRRSRENIGAVLPAVQMVLGERGRWLAEHNLIEGSWKKLYGETSTPLPLLYADDEEAAESSTEAAIVRLSQSPTLEVADVDILMQRRRVWSDALKRAVLAKVERSLALHNPYEAIRVLSEALPMFPVTLLLQIRALITNDPETEKRFTYVPTLLHVFLPLYQELNHE